MLLSMDAISIPIALYCRASTSRMPRTAGDTRLSAPFVMILGACRTPYFDRQSDAVTELATALPVDIVASAVGLPEEGRERMLICRCKFRTGVLRKFILSSLGERREIGLDPETGGSSGCELENLDDVARLADRLRVRASKN